MKKILILGAGGPAGVNVLKSLQSADESIELYGSDMNTYHVEYFRPLVKQAYLVPRCTAPNYIDVINGIIEKNGIEVIHPQPDIEVKILSENREKFKAKCFLPSKETVKICQDKFLSSERWTQKGFQTVKSILLRDDHLEDDIEKAFAELGPNLWIRATQGAGGTGSTPANSKDIVLHWIKYWRSRGEKWTFIAQENLTGRNVAFQSLWNKGELVVSQARERVEYIYPYLAPSGVTGTPTVAKTIHDDNVNKMATEAVKAIDEDATGIFCVDIKFDSKGNPMPTEINVGRFFTTSYFFSYAGKVYNRWYANMPHLLLKLAYGEEIDLSNVPKYNILPKDLYWVRHIDCGHYLVEDKNLMK